MKLAANKVKNASGYIRKLCSLILTTTAKFKKNQAIFDNNS